MKKKNILILLILIIFISPFTSCSDVKNTSKHTADTIFMKDGSTIKGLINRNISPSIPFIGIMETDGTIKNISKSEIISKDRITLNNDDIIEGHISLSESNENTIVIYMENGDEKTINKVDIKNKEKKYKLAYCDRILMVDDTLIYGAVIEKEEDYDELDSITLIKYDYSQKKIPTSNIKKVFWDGTLKSENEPNPIDEFIERSKRMGANNIQGENYNGWLYSILGVVVVFSALIIMVIAFYIMGVLMKERTAKKIDSPKNKKSIEVKEGEISPEIVSAICLALNLTEESTNQKVVLTINRQKSSCPNWAYSGRVDNANRNEF